MSAHEYDRKMYVTVSAVLHIESRQVVKCSKDPTRGILDTNFFIKLYDLCKNKYEFDWRHLKKLKKKTRETPFIHVFINLIICCTIPVTTGARTKSIVSFGNITSKGGKINKS